MKEPNSRTQTSLLPCSRNLELKIEGILYRLHGLSERSFPRFLRKGVLKPDYFIRVGARGPELVFLLNRSLSGDKSYDEASEELVRNTQPDYVPELFSARAAAADMQPERGAEASGPVRRNWNRYRAVAGVALCVLALFITIGGLRNDKVAADLDAGRLETRRAAGGEDYFQIGRLINKLVYSSSGMQSFASPSAERDFIQQEIGTLMKEFGAEEYSIPQEFVLEVNRFVKMYQERDHDLIARVLLNEQRRMGQVRQILRSQNLPEDLGYMALVESQFLESPVSQEGAAGFWQFTPATARDYGMRVDDEVDERLDLLKSTEAASRYIRELILDFGSGSSVMLAIAAYNGGPETVRRAVRNVKDPIKQRNFWYLYNTQALPNETREYVPKVCAAILIGRNPQRFGF